jgi:hypothetical protein
MSLDRPADNRSLPFTLDGHNNTVESVGSTVHLPDQKQGVVVKVSKADFPYETTKDALVMAQKYRELEEIAIATARETTQKAILPQTYVVAEGVTPGTARVVRVQKYVEGCPLRQLGFYGIMALGPQDIVSLKSLLADSMRCYLKNGVNYDLVGSDEDHIHKESKLFYLKRLVFPLRNSNNLMKTDDGIKLVDPNVYGGFLKKDHLKFRVQQGLLFASSLANHMILSAKQILG